LSSESGETLGVIKTLSRPLFLYFILEREVLMWLDRLDWQMRLTLIGPHAWERCEVRAAEKLVRVFCFPIPVCFEKTTMLSVFLDNQSNQCNSAAFYILVHLTLFSSWWWGATRDRK
jgi:hypothetical protein